MSGHTPGPWKAVDHPHYPGMMVVEGPESPITIVTSATDIDLGSHCRRVADAKLIAAAPDLLEALEEMYRHGVQAFGEDFDVMLTARDAIAKAKGAMLNIATGTVGQACHLANERGFSVSQWRYVYEPTDLQGRRGETLLIGGTFWQRTDADRVYEFAQALEMQIENSN